MSQEKPNVEELLARAREPARKAPPLHAFYRGKVAVTAKCAIRSYEDFAIWYTPGVAQPCREIHKDPEKVFEYTNKGNFVAVVSDGTRVLGLGDIGPLAALPVMEGKALLFKYLGGVDAFPITLATKDPEELIQAVKWIAPAFGGINLEDIASPKCFYVLERLRAELDIPVWHDDQQGTAAITLAGVINALKVVGKDPRRVTYAVIGAGAANIAFVRVLLTYGVPAGQVILVDSKGILHPGREDLEAQKHENPYKWEYALRTNRERRRGGIAEALEGADVCVAASQPGPGVIKPEWVARMAKDAVVFACANPVPEIWPWEAKEAGARIVGTGRSDFPNQINNSLGFPGIFRGVLDVFARTITDEMTIAAAEAIAKTAEAKGLREDYVVPTMEEWEVYVNEAVAVAKKAMEQGVARRILSESELERQAERMIRRAREEVQILMRAGHIAPPPAL
ncbi:MAG: NADP-dependent malic enzyme [Candidatus Bipolaricaulota bacterium]|nr:NADP-dependent malic enzyme [Candidatus Bipolaricaulota bacterium]MCX7844826.1 NADP-dependent malic enzyme [Candidatus Bipolaricaulota bacterium]MDW8151785.1 NADP-dependent malic enzyme [Candidatus Bipolaricaulota bacterium]